MAVRRIMVHHESRDLEARRTFSTRVLGLEEGDFGGGYMGVAVDAREAVDAAHAQAVEAGQQLVYGPVERAVGVRRFFVRDPNGVVLSVAHG